MWQGADERGGSMDTLDSRVRVKVETSMICSFNRGPMKEVPSVNALSQELKQLY